MEYNMKIRNTIPIMVSVAVLLSACGGGGTSSTPTVNKSSFKLTGSVPGTLIEAFCEDGSYHSIKSTKNGTSKHPFSLTLPTDLSCRLVMTTNEDDPSNKVVTPIKFVNDKGISSIAFSSKEDIDLDFVNLALKREDMLSDSNEDGVEDIPKEVLLSDASSSTINIIVSANDPLDDDKDGIINVFEDDDGDKIPNKYDDDDDGDGLLDTEDNDQNNDGKSDDDTDGDGIKNGDDKDDDNDGVSDDIDNDDDNDGIDDQDDIDTDTNDSNGDDGDSNSNDDSNGNDGGSNSNDSDSNSNDGDSNGNDDDSNGNDDDSNGNDGDSNGNDGDSNSNDDDSNSNDGDSNGNDDDSNGNDEDSNGNDSDSNNNGNGSNNGGSSPTGSVITTPSAGRLLASQCAQCHGTDGDSITDIDSLTGESRGEIVGEMLEMQSKNRNKLMHLQAKGYNSEQIGLIADYFSSLSGGNGNNNEGNDEEEDDD